MNRTFTKIKDLDIKILNELNDKDLASICQANQYANSLYHEETLWRNRVLKKYGKYLGTAPEIKKKYMNNFSWKQYYVWLTDTLNTSVNKLFFYCSKKGQEDILKILISNFPMHSWNIECMIMAIQKGHLNVVKIFLDNKIDPSIKDNLAIIQACINGHLDIVKYLLKDPRVDPSAQNNRALLCQYNRHHEIVELLMNDPRVISKLPIYKKTLQSLNVI